MTPDPDPIDRSVIRGVAYGCTIEAIVVLVALVGAYVLARVVGFL